MSLILDALNRADNERKNQDIVPGLNTVHPAPAIVLEDKSGRQYGLYIVIALVIIVLAVIAYWFIARSATTATASAQSNPAGQAAVASKAQVANSAAAQQQESKNPTATETAAPQSVVENEPAESMIAAKPAAAVEQLYTAPETRAISTDPQVNELYTAEEPAASESIDDPFAAAALAAEPTHITDTGRVAAGGPPARTFASIGEVQDFNELPWNTKQQIPTISYQRHNFLAGGISTVVINGQTLGVGNIASSSQLVVQEIFEDGVVLKRGNIVFKLRALNGWINM